MLPPYSNTTAEIGLCITLETADDLKGYSTFLEIGSLFILLILSFIVFQCIQTIF